MALFLLILGGLIVFNFILLKFSMQSVDADKKKMNSKNVKTTDTNLTKTSDIPKAA